MSALDLGRLAFGAESADESLKSRISRIENGHTPNPQQRTIQRLCHALDIPLSKAEELRRTYNMPSTKMADDLRAANEQLVKDLGLRDALVMTLAYTYAETTPEDFDTAYRGLEAALREAAEQRARSTTPTNHPDFIDAVLSRVATLNDEGETEAAGDELDTLLAKLEEEAESLTARRIRVLDAAIAQDRLRNDANSAAEKIARRVALDTPDPAALFNALRDEQGIWYERGRDKGLRLDLGIAIALARIAQANATTADDRGTALNDLGTALATLGERKQGTGRLEDAVACYRDALTEWTRDRVPMDWAMAQMNLGNALLTLGAREQGTERLEDAVACYRDALTEWTRDRVPMDWARTQMGLGTALRTLGEREQGTERLVEAIACFRDALTEWTRDRVPLQWAMVLGNEGEALLHLAERQTDAGMARQALAQLIEAQQVLREGGHLHGAETFERQIPDAQALVTRLSAP